MLRLAADGKLLEPASTECDVKPLRGCDQLRHVVLIGGKDDAVRRHVDLAQAQAPDVTGATPGGMAEPIVRGIRP